jgi:dTDP-4-dehydrorhamnose reductase
VLRESKVSGLDVVGWSGSHAGSLFGVEIQPIDLAHPDRVALAIREVRPDLLIHTAALARIEACRRDPERARQINLEGTAVLSQLAASAGTRMLHVSTDLVFDGTQGNYRESDRPAPLSVYGRTKHEAELAVLADPRNAVARVSLLFGPTLTHRQGFFDQQLAALRAGSPLTLYEDEWRTPVSILTAARALVNIARSDFAGLIHIGGPEKMSRLEMGRRLAVHLAADPSGIQATSRLGARSAEPQPRDLSLDASLWRSRFPREPWPNFEAALREMEVASHAGSDA